MYAVNAILTAKIVKAKPIIVPLVTLIPQTIFYTLQLQLKSALLCVPVQTIINFKTIIIIIQMAIAISVVLGVHFAVTIHIIVVNVMMGISILTKMLRHKHVV